MKTITLTAKQMATLVIVYSYYDCGSGLNAQLQAIMLKYRKGIPDDCQKMFELKVSTTDHEDTTLLRTISEAICEDGLSDHKEALVSLHEDIDVLLSIQ